MDLRQHRKMIMIDNYIAHTGSMNMVELPFPNKMRAAMIDLMGRRFTTAMGIIYSATEIETGNAFRRRHQMSILCHEAMFIHTIASGPAFEDLIHQYY